MSADLFAAFGVAGSAENSEGIISSAMLKTTAGQLDRDHRGTDQWILQSQTIPQPIQKQQKTSLWNKDRQGADVLFDAFDDNDDIHDDDDFGDFEAVHTGNRGDSPQPNQQGPSQSNINLLSLDAFPDLQITQPQAITSALYTPKESTSDLLGIEVDTDLQVDGLVNQNVESSDVWTTSVRSSGSQLKASVRQQDQDQGSVDDDWGNFEAPETEETGTEAEAEAVERRDTGTDLKVGPTTFAQVMIPQPSKGEIVPDDDPWDDFEDSPAATKLASHQLSNRSPSPAMRLKEVEPGTTLQHQSSTSRQRPTNIPPPSTLLQLLPQIYQSISLQSRQNKSFSTLAQEIVQVYTTTARILAGRPLRWKRDTFLSQSTRISQAGLKNTGMKLTALDKSETIKEDQEAQEAISAWTRNAAALNSVMLKAKVSKPPMSLGVNMGIKVANGPGVFNAKECCAICGLKRNERVLGIDINVEDSFGEFWVEFWGHRGCADFWYTHEEMLRRR